MKDPALHLQALQDVARAARSELGYAVLGACASPVTGATGNREFFLHLSRHGSGLGPERIETLTTKVVAS